MNAQLALIRPGATEYDRQGRIQGKLDVPLNPQGQQDVLNLSCELTGAPFQKLYSAACESARQTAAALALKLGIRSQPLFDLYNVDHGLWEGMLVSEVERKHRKVFRQWLGLAENICPPQGETLSEARERVREALIWVCRKHPDGLVGLVVPEPLYAVCRQCLIEGDLPTPWELQARHPRWEMFAPRAVSLVGAPNL